MKRFFQVKERNPQLQEALGPRLETEVHNLLQIQIIDQIIKETLRHALAIFVVTGFPEACDLLDRLHAERQLHGDALLFGGAGFPGLDAVFGIVDDGIEAFARDAVVEIELDRMFNALAG